jgi:hypothetical protein
MAAGDRVPADESSAARASSGSRLLGVLIVCAIRNSIFIVTQRGHGVPYGFRPFFRPKV